MWCSVEVAKQRKAMPNVDEIDRSHDVASSRACTALSVTYDTSLRPPGRCGALAEKRRKQLGNHFLVSSELKQKDWRTLLKIAENCNRFCSNLKVNSGIRIGPTGGLGARR